MARTGLASVRGERDSGSGGGSAVPPVEPDVAASSDPPRAPEAPPPWELLAPLTAGAAVAHGWRVSELSGAVNGSYVLTLANERGASHRVHLCRNAGRPQGVVYTERFDLLVMNGGQGELPTDEGFAQAVAAVAHVVAANEKGHHDESLLAHAERLERFAAAATLR